MKNERNFKNGKQNGGEFKQWMGVQTVFGHLHQFREIPNSNPLAHSVRISVPQGRGETIRYAALELVVESLPAFQLLNKYAEKINNDVIKSTLTFNFYGVNPKAYALKNEDGTYKVNENGELELRAFIAGKLSHISYLKVDNIVIYGGSGSVSNSQPDTGDARASETGLLRSAETVTSVDAKLGKEAEAVTSNVAVELPESKKTTRRIRA